MHVQSRTSRGRALTLAALSALTFQNTALVLLMKQSYRKDAVEYSAGSVVVLSELIKFFLCVIKVSSADGHRRAVKAVRTAPTNISLALPSVLYIVQNNLLFEGVRNLPVSVYVVGSQAKILTSALFSYFLLGVHISYKKAGALLILVAGMTMVQLPNETNQGITQERNYFLGLSAVLLACCTSGFAGVSLERIYKSDGGGSVWEKNMQLSCFSLPLSLMAAVAKDHELFRSDGFFYGYDATVCAVILLQAAGGLIVAIVMRHASTVLKCFAVALSICLCTIVSASQGHETLSFSKIAGILFVNFATFLYSTR